MEESELELGTETAAPVNDHVIIDLHNASKELRDFVNNTAKMAEHHNLAHNDKIKSRATKARKILSDLGKSCKDMRKSILAHVKGE